MNWMQCLWAFVGCMCFALVFNIRSRRILILASLGAGLGWMVYLLLSFMGSDVMQSFFATIVLSFYSEIMARVFLVPVTTFQTIALLPLVPGSGIYRTMEYYVMGDTELFIQTGLHTFAIAGALAIGVLMVSSLVRAWTMLRRQRKKKGTC
ncbi:threonine/serine exporter family protein [Oscillospiraceae bacterium MB08-C2-2]|nr:threonine/serine exporter family protein [Oscillospiraceae bacterium MB08-C2-2]